MKLVCEDGRYTLYKEREVIGTAAVQDGVFSALEIAPAWRGRGYGSYLVKEILRSGGGLDAKTASLFTAPLPDSEAGLALARKFGFVPAGDKLVRRRVPDLSAVQLCHDFLQMRLMPGGLYLDATCGNGHDTLFLCRLAGDTGRVLGLDIQPQAVANTNKRLQDAGFGAVGRAVLHDHADLGALVQPGLRAVQFWVAAGRRTRGTFHRRGQPARTAQCADGVKAGRRAGRRAVQRKNHRRRRKAGGAGVFPQPAADAVHRAGVRVCQLGKHRAAAVFCDQEVGNAA